MRTVYLGAYGYGNLGDELCLLEAMASFPTAQAFVWSSAAQFTAHAIGPRRAAGYFSTTDEMAGIKPERVVLGGGALGTRESFDQFLPMMVRALDWSAEIHIHNIGVANIQEADWPPPHVLRLFEALRSFSVRDTVSQRIVRQWAPNVPVVVSSYPERFVAPQDEFPGVLPEGPKLGLSLTAQCDMRSALRQNIDLVRTLFNGYDGHAIIPIISTVHASAPEENDAEAVREFIDMAGLASRVALPEMLDPTWWRNTMTVHRLKSLIGHLNILISQRKHNIIHGIAARVPAIGLYPAPDDSLPRLFNTLFHDLPTRSRLVPLSVI